MASLWSPRLLSTTESVLNFFSKLTKYSQMILSLNVRIEYKNSKTGNSQVNMKTNTHFWSYLIQLFLQWKIPQIRVERKLKRVFYFQKLYFEHFSVYEIMWENVIEPERLRMILWRMRISRCEVKTAKTQSEYVILTAFPLQQWLHKRAWILRYK
jgi:hypothetical protein